MKLPLEDVEHLIRLAGILAAGLVVFLLVRALLVPDDFGVFGHYRASAVEANGARPIVYAGQKACAECHADVVDLRAGAGHKSVSCESCHGPAARHAEGVEGAKPNRPDGRQLCGRCHAANTGKPVWYRTVDVKDHAGDEACISCHKAHDPRMQ